MSTNQDVLDYAGALPLSRGGESWNTIGLPPALKSTLYALAACVLLLCAFSYTMAGWHVAQVPDSFGRELHRDLWVKHFFPQRFYSRLGLLTLAAGLSLIALARWERTVRVMRLFWLGIAHPLNLAIYRITLFSTIFFNLDDDCDRKQITMFAGLKHALYVPPTGMQHILPWLPVNPFLASWSLTLMNVFCITAILGFFSRTSAALVLIFGVYALGIPQYFGQCNHYHHMLWLTAIMIASRCGDYLSIDAILGARRRAALTGFTESPAPARAYSLPLRFVMMTVAMCYFFPGLWKYWVQGIGWAWTDNFKHLMEWKWINMGEQEFGVNFTPLFRLDHYPWMYKPSAMIALVFELSFGVLIFFPRARYLCVMMGVGFHRMIAFMMRIPFYTLQTNYVAWFNWRPIFEWVGRKVFKQPMVLAYDSANVNAAKAVATLRAVDLLGTIQYVDDPSRARDGAFAAVTGGGTFDGAAALHAAANRNPLLWILYPLRPLLLPNPASTEGSPAHASALRGVNPFAARGINFGILPLALTFAVVFTPNFILGLRRQYHGWPFGCYPLFEKIRGHYKEEFEVEAFDEAGQQIAWDDVPLMRDLSKPRYSTMCRRVRENKRPDQLQAFWDMLVSRYPQLEKAKTVRFVEKKQYSAPERWNDPPLQTVVLGEAEVGEKGSIAKVKMDPNASGSGAATKPTAVTSARASE